METEDYKLIPMSKITDEAREITVAWMECEDKHWIGQKHKLASDIMNYAKKYHTQIQGCDKCVFKVNHDKFHNARVLFEKQFKDVREVTDEMIEKHAKEYLKATYTPITKREVHELLVIFGHWMRSQMTGK